MGESIKGLEVLGLYPNGNGSKIPFYSRIGTKLIVGFLIIPTITGIVGYVSLNYTQTVGEKFHLLLQQSLPTIDSLKEMKCSTEYRSRYQARFGLASFHKLLIILEN